MTQPLFVSHSKLESWIDAGEVAFEGGILSVPAQGRSYRLAPAARVTALIEGEDAKGLLGRVVSLAELEALGAEHLQGTVILGDTGYTCDDGFVGIEQAADAPAAPQPAEAQRSDADLLVDFLLKHL